MKNESEYIAGKEDREIYKKTFPTKEMETRIVQALYAKNLVGAPGKGKHKWALAATLLLLIFGLGLYAGKMIPLSGPQVKNQYLLLLYEPGNFINGNGSHVQEYGKWYHMLEKKQKISSGEELQDKGWLFSQKSGKTIKNENYIAGENGRISGFFIINASSETEAISIATTCPHIKYNGIVEVRPFQYH